VLIERLKQAGLVVAVAAFVMLTNLGGPRLWDRDEGRNAGCALEMLQRQDWVVPTFNTELRTHKPVLLYWGIMVSYLALGVGELAARLPSALAAIGTTFCVYLMGRRLFGPRAGVWAGIVLATSLMFVVAGRAATPDSLLIFCTTLAQTIFVCNTFRPRFATTPDDVPPEPIQRGELFPQYWPAVLAMYAAMGLAVLAKGPVGLVLPTAVIGLFLLIARLRGWNATQGNATEGVPYSRAERVPFSVMRVLAPFEPLHFLRTCWHMRPLTAIFAATAVALPWYWAVGLATDGEFLRGFFFEHNLARATGVMEGHSGNILYYPAAILFGFFPWSIFAVPLAIDTILQLRRRERFHAGYLLAVCWIGVYVVLFSLARTQLPSYVTPCYPALAMLAGDYIDRWSRQAAAVAGGWLLAAFGCLAAAGIGLLVAVPIAAKTYHLTGDEWLGLIGLIPLAGGVACIGFAAVRNFKAASSVLAATAVTLCVLLFALAAQRIDRHQSSGTIAAAIRAIPLDRAVAAYKILEPTWVFYGGRPIQELKPTPQANYSQRAHEFFLANPDGLLIAKRSQYHELAPHIPAGIVVVAQTRQFLKEDSLLVLGRARFEAEAQNQSPPRVPRLR